MPTMFPGDSGPPDGKIWPWLGGILIPIALFIALKFLGNQLGPQHTMAVIRALVGALVLVCLALVLFMPNK